MGGFDNGIRGSESGRRAQLLGVSLCPGAGGTYVDVFGGRERGGGGDRAGEYGMCRGGMICAG